MSPLLPHPPAPPPQLPATDSGPLTEGPAAAPLAYPSLPCQRGTPSTLLRPNSVREAACPPAPVTPRAEAAGRHGLSREKKRTRFWLVYGGARGPGPCAPLPPAPPGPPVGRERGGRARSDRWAPWRPGKAPFPARGRGRGPAPEAVAPARRGACPQPRGARDCGGRPGCGEGWGGRRGGSAPGVRGLAGHGRLVRVGDAFPGGSSRCAGICSYEGRGGMCSIRLSEPLLKLRPRKDLVEVCVPPTNLVTVLVPGSPNGQSHRFRRRRTADVKDACISCSPCSL